MKNQGKIFEENFRKSLDLNNPDLFFYRFRDNPASFGNQNNQFIRFTSNNICDNMIFYKGHLFLCELKSHHGKSLPLNCIRENQFNELYAASFKKNVHSVLIIFFSDLEECYVTPISLVNQIREENKTKSISLLSCREKCLKIQSRKLQTNYRYNVIDFLEEYIKRE